MDSFQAHYADIRDPSQQPRVVALLRDEGLVTFSGITDRTELAAMAGRLMAIRPHRDADPDGVTMTCPLSKARIVWRASSRASSL